MRKVTDKWFHNVCQTVEDKCMPWFLEIMYLVFKSLWVLFPDADLLQQENTAHLRDEKQNLKKINKINIGCVRYSHKYICNWKNIGKIFADFYFTFIVV